jgi:hypothetical protein
MQRSLRLKPCVRVAAEALARGECRCVSWARRLARPRWRRAGALSAVRLPCIRHKQMVLAVQPAPAQQLAAALRPPGVQRTSAASPAETHLAA